MAVVLGHELAHIQEGHVLKGAMGSLALNVLAIVLETQVPGAGQAAGGIGQLFLNRYSQSQERAADEVGLRYAYEAGFDPRAAVDVQERLAVEAPQSMSAGYFDTHPSSVERAVAAREHARQLLAQGDPPGREEVLAMERADRPGPAARRRRESTYAPRDRDADPDAEPDPRPRARPSRPASESGSEDCRRAEVYADMARDAQGPAERKELEARARRYCPSLADASTSPRRSRDESDEPADAY